MCGGAGSSGNWWNDQTSPLAVCAEKTLDRFQTREVTDVMPRVFTHLQHGGGIYVQEYIILENIWKNQENTIFSLIWLCQCCLKSGVKQIGSQWWAEYSHSAWLIVRYLFTQIMEGLKSVQRYADTHETMVGMCTKTKKCMIWSFKQISDGLKRISTNLVFVSSVCFLVRPLLAISVSDLNYGSCLGGESN